MTKILLTSGSSFSYDFQTSADDPTADVKFKRWPLLLSEKLDYKLINQSKPGASNIYIYDQLMENILRYDKDIGLVVAGWSYGFKTSVFRNCELNFVNLQDQDMGDAELIDSATKLRNKIEQNNQIAESLEQSLRLIVYLQEFCDSKNIKCIHYPLLNLFKTDLDHNDHIAVLEKVSESYFFKKIQQFDNVIGWPSDTFLGGYSYATAYPDLIISELDHHPNAQGQKIIADEIYDKYLKL
jgi:hypothetical protein